MVIQNNKHATFLMPMVFMDVHEMKSFIVSYNVDVFLTSETHLTCKYYIMIRKYKSYDTASKVFYDTNYEKNQGGKIVIMYENIQTSERKIYQLLITS